MGGQWLGLAVAGAIAISMTCGGLFEPVIDVSYRSPGVQVPTASGAVRVPLRAVFMSDPATELSDADPDAVSACAQGQNVDGRLALTAMIIEASPGGELRVAGRPNGRLDADGRFAPADLKGQLHTAAYDTLLEHAENAKDMAARGCSPAQPGRGAAFDGRILFVLDQQLPFTTVQSLLYTAGQAQFTDFLLLVDDPGAASNRLVLLQAPSGQALGAPVVLLGPEGYRITAPGVPTSHQIELGCGGPCTSMGLYPESELQARMSELRPLADRDAVVVAPDGGTPWAAVVRTLGAVSATPSGDPLFPHLIIAGSPLKTESALVLQQGQVSPIHWNLNSEITVLRLSLPEMGPGLMGEPPPQTALANKVAELSGAGSIPQSKAPDSGGGLAMPGGLGTELPHSAARAGKPTIKGNIDGSAVQKVIQRSSAQIRYCHARALTKDPSLSGNVDMRFVINREGGVSSASVQGSSLGNEAVESCLVGRFKRMRFPEPKGGGIVIVNYPLVFGAD